MAYKVLGQSSATAAAASTTLNLVKDPSFEGITASMTSTPAGISNSDTWAQLPGTQWYYSTRDGSYWNSLRAGSPTTWTGTDDTSGAGSSKYGSLSIGFGSSSTSGTYSGTTGITFGLATINSTNFLREERTLAFGGATRSIPVTGSTTYYFGCDMAGNSMNDWYMDVYWFNSSGTYLSKSNKALTFSSGSFTRNTQTATSPATAVYAGIVISGSIYQNNRMQGKIDGVYFGTDSDYGTAFKEPTTPTNLLLTSPFTSRYAGTWSGTANNSTTINNFAGASVTLYTVPAGKETVISTITATNASTSAQTYRIAVVPNGETLSAKHWIIFDGSIPAFGTEAVTIGMTLAAGDSVVVSSDVTTTQFTAFGSEA